ncbi:hypothetical protein MMC25_002391 [Agyrium rufum]|nr:hypothetical protein [Agyrium rufum]
MGTLLQHPTAASNLDSMTVPTGLTARRSAASHLPQFELPPPPLSKYAPYNFSFPNASYGINHIGHGSSGMSASNNNSTTGNLLTPPSNIPGESLSPISSGNNSAPNTAASTGLPPYTPNASSYWPTGSGLTPFTTFGTGTTPQPQPWGSQGASGNLFPPRALFSPSLTSMLRNVGNSPAGGEGVPAPTYEYQLPPFPTSMPLPPGTLPALTPQQQTNLLFMNNQATSPNNQNQSPPQLTTGDPYMSHQRLPPTPAYFNGSQPSSTPQQSHFPSLSNPSPVQQSPMSAGPPSSRLSPTTHQSSNLQPSHALQPFGTRQYGTYNPLPNMAGPVMSNLHSPGGHMSLMGSLQPGMTGPYNSGAAQMQHMYGTQQQQVPHNERPFKCDQCPQSFNRNHDLKRHKRIHLAVKPFPCGYCDKSFSRKDALKRHVLVKGCGKSPQISGSGPTSATKSDSTSQSPVDKNDNYSSDDEELSPRSIQRTPHQ